MSSAPRQVPVLPFLCALGALTASVLAQRQFAEDTTSYLPHNRGEGFAMASADVDGDGDQDLLVANNPVAFGSQNRLYLGDGSGHFTDATATHLPVGRYRTNEVAFGDVDGDGDPDLVSANEYGEQNRLYLNDGSGRFVDATFGRLPVDNTSTRAVVIQDLDGDGDLDLAFATYRQDLLYLNDGLGVFTDVTATHMAPNATSSWDIDAADVDADGDLDLVLAEQQGQALLLNDGNARFIDVSASQVPAGPQCVSVALGDVDGDGDPDLVASYWQAQPTLYLNDGTGTFTGTTGKLATSATSVRNLELGDVDGDGDPDLVMACWLDRWLAGRQLHLNDGSGTFTDVTASQVHSRSTNASYYVCFVDADMDGDLDLATPGFYCPDGLLLNDGNGVFADATRARLYSIMDFPHDVALADLDGDGHRDLVCANGFDDWQSWPNRLHLNDGRGHFADVTPTNMPDDNDESMAVATADVDQDGDVDLVFGNFPGQNKLYLNDGSAVFTDVTAARLPAATDNTTSLAMGDVDGDGSPDIVVGNLFEPSKLYLNDGAGTFTDATAIKMPSGGHETRAVALGDVNADGSLDIVMATGLTWGAQNRLYLNDGTGAFTDATAANMPVRLHQSACVALGDVDGDGDLDMVFGNDIAGTGFTNWVYINNGAGVFSSRRIIYDLSNTRAIALADVDEDGDLDVVCGDDDHYNKLYLNDGTGNFTEASQRLSRALENTRALAMGDVDGDGDLDMVAGNTGVLQSESAIHINHHRQLVAPRLAAIGETYRLDVYSKAGYATVAQTAIVFLGLAPASIALPPHGVFGLQPGTAVQLPTLALLPPAGMGSALLPIPSVPAFVGLTLYWQALVVPTPNPAAARLTNVLAERINAF